ncbi:hypothetical protein CK224_19305 [Mesorhizobium sp. WSM3862]|nr:hypothetical protein CK224_19305 [Mesorhizobium sp. WSM3862]
MVQFTRQELYELVWSEPINTVAEKHGLSGRGLAKICERHQIPVPGRGHWARIEAGQKVTKTPLWRIDNPALEHVSLGWRRTLHPQAAFAAEATRKAKAEFQPPKATKVEIRKIGSRLHRSVIAFEQEMRRAPVDHEGGIKRPWVYIHRESVPRVLTLLHTLAHELEPDGITFLSTDESMWFIRGASKIHFEISSPKKRVKSPAGSWRSFENVFVGRLALQIFGSSEGIKKNWVDKDGIQIESDLRGIVFSIKINLMVQAEIDEQRQKAEDRRAFYAHRKDLEQKRIERERARETFLATVAQDRMEIIHLKETVALLPDPAALSPALARMVDWAVKRVADLEERTTPIAIDRALEKQMLFPEPDNLADPGEYMN